MSRSKLRIDEAAKAATATTTTTTTTTKHKGPASEAQMWNLWRSLVRHFIEIMDDAKAGKKRVSAAHLAVLRQFLRDNAVAVQHAHQVPPRNPREALDVLASLPFPSAKNGKH